MTRFKKDDDVGFQRLLGRLQDWIGGPVEPEGQPPLKHQHVVTLKYAVVIDPTIRQLHAEMPGHDRNAGGPKFAFKDRRPVDNVCEQEPSHDGLYQFPRGVAYFVPRENLISEIQHGLSCATHFDPPSVILAGMGGSGKTQLALEFCRQSRDVGRHEAIFWIPASSKAAFLDSMENIWSLIKSAEEPSLRKEAAANAAVRTISRWNCTWMLVLDNYDDPGTFSDIQKFLPRGHRGSLLVTSRHRQLQSLGVMVEVSSLDEAAALELLKRRSEQDIFEETADLLTAKYLVQVLGCLALAIDQAGSYIRDCGYTLGEFLPQYAARKQEILSSIPDFWHYREESAESVFTTWELSFRLLNDRHGGQETKAGLMLIFSLLDFRDIHVDLFGHFSGIFSDTPIEARPRWVATLVAEDGAWNRFAIREVLGDLVKRSLVQGFLRPRSKSVSGSYESVRVSLHPLIREWVQLRSSRQSKRECLEEAIGLLAKTQHLQLALHHFQALVESCNALHKEGTLTESERSGSVARLKRAYFGESGLRFGSCLDLPGMLSFAQSH